MIEPYATLFAGYENHWLFGPYLTSDDPDWNGEPDWNGLLTDEKRHGLSTGEKVLLDIACWFAGPWYQLDAAHKRRVAVAALLLTQNGLR